MKNIGNKISWKKMSGLVPAIIQDAWTSRVLMFAFMNKESLQKTIKTRKVWFYSRSKKRLWMKGEESKNYLYLKDILLDCDNDAFLIRAKPAGPTCHLNNESCFDVGKAKNNQTADVGIIAELFYVIVKRKQVMPPMSYTASLFRKGNNRICAKIMEEAREVCKAAKKETKKRLVQESVDVLYHLMVLLVENNVGLKEVLREIEKRRKKFKSSSNPSSSARPNHQPNQTFSAGASSGRL